MTVIAHRTSAATGYARGPEYDRTVGRVIDHDSLAIFLLDGVRLQQSCTHFWDAPCGTGRLLRRMAMLCPELVLFGIDRSAEQLAIARHGLERCTLIQGDVLAFSQVSRSCKPPNAFCHVGYCFFNLLQSGARVALLREFVRSTYISHLGFEIQNTEHQAQAYIPGTWYTRCLAGGGLLMTKSERVSEEAIKLYMRFVSDELRTIREDSVLLHAWPLGDCISDCRKVGWDEVEVYPAEYREAESAVNSHWFVVTQRF